MPVNPYQLFGLPASRTARHHTRRCLLHLIMVGCWNPTLMRPVPFWALSRAKLFFQTAGRIHRAVMQSTKPNVQRKIHASIIALEIAVMQLVVEMTDKQPAAVAKHQLVKPGMLKDR